ncbi:MAG: hypothetical protein K0Q52_156 [Microbacterium sp.]|jgi:hypothetical protein|nr:hypothetical protein [Microbacterium sp.]
MTTFEIRDSSNYAAQVVRVPTPFPLPKADRLVGVGIFGYTVITQKDGDIHEGDLAVFFPAEAQLSHALAAGAGLYRHSELNDDPADKGYLEDNRRVRALKLRGSVSNGLLLPVHVVAAAFGLYVDDFTEGVAFDHIDGHEISRKFRVKEPVSQGSREERNVKKAFKRVDAKLFPVHIETDQYLRNEDLLSDDDVLIATQKLHGTSWRGTRTLVRNQLSWLERLAQKLGVRVEERSFDLLAGSRQVIKDPKSETQQHHYGRDLWTEHLAVIGDRIPENVIVYGELVGWVGDETPIQKGHTYRLANGQRELYVYRVSIITNAGELYDLSWDQVRTFCDEHGLKHVPELWRGFKRDFVLEDFREKDFHAYAYGYSGAHDEEPYLDRPLPLDANGTGADEGIAIRVDRGGRVPLLFKYKNDSHYLYETAQLDAGEVDLESEEAVAA